MLLRHDHLAASLDGDKIHITFHAADSFSPIKRAEFSVDANDWQYVEPVGQIADSKTETYDFRVPLPDNASGSDPKPTAVAAKNPAVAAIDHVVVVRVYDRYDNMSAAKMLIRGK